MTEKLPDRQKELLESDAVLQRLNGFIGTTVAGRYEVLRLLGSGSSASVYLAKDARRLSLCAIKLTHPDIDPDGAVVARFQREYELASTLTHLNIVRAFDIGEIDGGVWYIAMEYVEGETLDWRLHGGREKGLPLDEVLSFAYQLILGVEAAHAKAIVHRDLKPGNLMVTEEGVLKILDFGVAKPLRSAEQLTVNGDWLGTLPYMAPEILTTGQLGLPADIYSFGIVVFELLAGVPPFVATLPNALVLQKLHLPFPNIRERRRDCPGWLADLIEDCVVRESEERAPTGYVVKEVREKIPREMRGG